MSFQAVAVFFVALVNANAVEIGLPIGLSRGALEGALGGQWIPDVPADSAPLAAPLASAPLLSIPGLASPYYAAQALPTPYYAAPGLGLGFRAPVVSSRGELEGVLGGQWIPDVLPEN